MHTLILNSSTVHPRTMDTRQYLLKHDYKLQKELVSLTVVRWVDKGWLATVGSKPSKLNI